MAAAVPDTKDFTLLQGVFLALVNDIDERLIAVLVQLNPVDFRLAVELQEHPSLSKSLLRCDTLRCQRAFAWA